jgi:hypothetical protein
MENSMEKLQIEDDFINLTEQAKAFVRGYREFLREELKETINPFTRIKLLDEEMRLTDKNILLLRMEILHRGTVIDIFKKGLHKDVYYT